LFENSIPPEGPAPVVCLNWLAAADTRKDIRLFILAVRRDEDRHRLADHLSGFVPEQLFGHLVEGPGLPSPAADDPTDTNSFSADSAGFKPVSSTQDGSGPPPSS
jgi:hypothetical protein